MNEIRTYFVGYFAAQASRRSYSSVIPWIVIWAIRGQVTRTI